MNLHFWLLLGTLYDMSWGFTPQNFHLAHKSCRTCCTQEGKSWNFAAFLEHCVMKWQDKTALLRPFSPLVRQSANYLGSNLTGKFAESFELAHLSADVASLSNTRGARSAQDAQSCSFRHRCCSRQTRASLNASECSDTSPTLAPGRDVDKENKINGAQARSRAHPQPRQSWGQPGKSFFISSGYASMERHGY